MEWIRFKIVMKTEREKCKVIVVVDAAMAVNGGCGFIYYRLLQVSQSCRLAN